MRAEIGAKHVTWQTVLGHSHPEVCSGQFYASPELKSYHGNGLGQSVCGQFKPVIVVFLLLARKEEPITSAVLYHTRTSTAEESVTGCNLCSNGHGWGRGL